MSARADMGRTDTPVERDSEVGADQGVAVRAPFSIGGARTHTPPGSQREEEGVSESLPCATDMVVTEDMRQIDPDKLEEMFRAEHTRRVAKRLLDAEERPFTPMPPAVSLTKRFASARPVVGYRIDDWFVEGGHVVLVAQYKSGKTTTLANFVRSVVDGEPFLGVAKTTPVDSVVMLDFEMSPAQIEAWLQDVNIRNTDRVHLVTLRGAASSFDILNPTRRREWAARLRELNAQIATVDCLRPAMDALGLNEHSDAGVWLGAFDELLQEAGIPEALLVHHSGHGGDRSRGDSRILDWPDGIWNLVRADRDDLNSKRFISAKGRDISVDEGELVFDRVTRHLTYNGRDRKSTNADRALWDAVREVSMAEGPLSTREVVAALRNRHSRGSVESALRRAVTGSVPYLARVKGPKGSHLHSILPTGREFIERHGDGVPSLGEAA